MSAWRTWTASVGLPLLIALPVSAVLLVALQRAQAAYLGSRLYQG